MPLTLTQYGPYLVSGGQPACAYTCQVSFESDRGTPTNKQLTFRQMTLTLTKPKTVKPVDKVPHLTLLHYWLKVVLHYRLGQVITLLVKLYYIIG